MLFELTLTSLHGRRRATDLVIYSPQETCLLHTEWSVWNTGELQRGLQLSFAEFADTPYLDFTIPLTCQHGNTSATFQPKTQLLLLHLFDERDWNDMSTNRITRSKIVSASFQLILKLINDMKDDRNAKECGPPESILPLAPVTFQNCFNKMNSFKDRIIMYRKIGKSV